VTDFYKLLFLNVFFTAIVTGCVSLPPAGDTPGAFALKGKVAVRENGENFSANILWQQTGGGFEIDLWGPLGQGRTQLVKKNAEIQVLNGRGEVLTRGDAEAVMREQIGWALPIEVLPAWVQGRPVASEAADELSYDDSGRVASFRQLDWSVQLERYETLSNTEGTRDLPTRITAWNERTRLRLVISEWEI